MCDDEESAALVIDNGSGKSLFLSVCEKEDSNEKLHVA